MNQQPATPPSMDSDTALPSMEPITLTPVGFVRSEIREPLLRADQDGLSHAEGNEKIKQHRHKVTTLISKLVINPELAGILDGIEGFSHLLVLYWPHLVPASKRNLIKVHPMGRHDIPARGIFATCSPARPNPILVTAVRLLEHRENILWVQGFEAVDGSPILDIKPYNADYYRIQEPTLAKWMADLHQERETPSDNTDRC